MDTSALKDVAIHVSTYFRDFLETDFKRQQAPRRRIVATTDTGFRASMRTQPYPRLDRELWTLLSRPSQNLLTMAVAPRDYTRPISLVLLKVISEQINTIPETALITVRSSVEEIAIKTLAMAVSNPEQWVEQVQQILCEKVGEQIVRPLIAHLDGPLKAQAYDLIDSLYAAEADLIERVAGDLARVLPDVLAKLLATQETPGLTESLDQFLTLQGVRSALVSFFESFAAADAYLELRDLETYVATGDGLQLYLYIGSVKFGPNAYPLFFLPIDVSRKAGNAYTLTLVNHLYANKRAIDYVLQELAAQHNRAWTAPITERITYLQPEQSVFEVANQLFRSVANAVDLGGQVQLGSGHPDASTASVRLSSSLYLAAAERSDEALLNDYEEIIDLARKGGAAIVDLFEGIVGDVLLRNPISIKPEVEQEWDALPMVDRMVFDSPIPLNEEQRKVLLAVRCPKGKVIKVSGPPGTGKSHTITAIAADCAFNQRSCLVLSDKGEALDVVYEKLSEAMSRVRHDRDFPNPILRLGRQDNNFKKLTSSAAVAQISAYSSAMRANRGRVEGDRSDKAKALKANISKTITTLGNVKLQEVQLMHEAESELEMLCPDVLQVLHRTTDAGVLPELLALGSQMDGLETYLRAVFQEGDFTPVSLTERAKLDAILTEFASVHPIGQWGMFEVLDAAQVRQISATLLTYGQLKMPIFGYLFRGGRIRELENQLNTLPTTRPIHLRDNASALQGIVAGANGLRIKLENSGLGNSFPAAYRALGGGKIPPPAAKGLSAAIALLARIDPGIIESLLAQTTDEAKLWPLTVNFLTRWLATRQAFVDAPQFDYVGTKTQLERLNTSVMNAHVDARLISFMDNNRADAKALAGLISNRQKFPEEKFDKVRESFPVIVASIREFGEYMPLAPDLFDVVVIDEASQVSVAQALPALLRARKVVVLGDDKQFSNVKSSNASIELNDKYRSNLVNYFRTHISQQADVLQRLGMFDVKRSILDFASLTASYEVMLRKHFRSYPELIGYSSGTFYNHQLQAIKIRGKPVEEVIRFDQIDASAAKATRGTNQAEAQFILDRLLELVEQDNPPSVGIITPFREQQTLLSKLLFSHAKGRDFEDKLNLKAWTFDTCQGEERHIIFYSMVATDGNDALNYIFPVSMADAEQAVEEKLKVQRLNVGFSRAQETIWIVHSKPLDQYRGSIGQALQHYARVLDKAANQAQSNQTDQASPMEAKVLDWFYATGFYQANMAEIEVLPQFEIGSYLRQLDATYEHPAWRVDFLILVRTVKKVVQIVIEYDGFEHHFRKGAPVNEGNHQRYLLEADLERQLTLESYGYRFLRINRFNLGSDPIATMSDRLTRLVEIAVGEQPISSSVQHIQSQASGLADKSLKMCSRCRQIKEPSQFYDPELGRGAGGFGRVCMKCKTIH